MGNLLQDGVQHKEFDAVIHMGARPSPISHKLRSRNYLQLHRG